MILWRFLNGARLKYVSTLSVFMFLVACSGGDDGASKGGSGVGVGNSGAALSWIAPSKRADNTALLLSDIKGYRIYFGVEKGVYLGQIDIDDSTATQAKISGIPSGRYFAVVTTIDRFGLESKYSLEVEVEATPS